MSLIKILLVGSILIALSTELTDLQKARAESFKFEAQLFQCQSQLTSMQLTNKKLQLEKEFEHEGKAFNWDTLSLTDKQDK